MPRIARIITDKQPCHITQRGNNRQDVFLDDEDRKAYLTFLNALAQKYSIHVLGYCLMTNHVHLVVIPETAATLAKAIGGTHFRYTQYFNRKYKRSGHLWQNRFYSVVLEDNHVIAAMRYIERNPVRIGEVKKAEDYPWSTAKAHINGTDPDKRVDIKLWKQIIDNGDWRQVLRAPEEELEFEGMRKHTMTGRPYGSEGFLKKLERRLDRRVRALPVGRPKTKRNRP
jgi:putative transposase